MCQTNYEVAASGFVIETMQSAMSWDSGGNATSPFQKTK